MSSPDPLVNRLQDQKFQIARMFAPGSKRPLGSQTSWNFSPVALDFGGRKFELAAKKMQILKKENLGEARSERTMHMANTIQAKFKDAHAMLHISGADRKENSFWSEVEKVFPNQSAGRAETSTESDGILRRGSVIQQFSTFPKLGQSLESIKEQTSRNPVMRKVDTTLPKRANLSPKDRLFSRVQELTAGQKEKKNIEQADVEKPVASSSPALSENVQRQVEQVSTPSPGENALPQVAVQDLSPSADENIQRRVEQVLPQAPKQIVQRKTEQTVPLTPHDSTVKSPQPDSNDIVQRKIEMPAPPAQRKASVKSPQPDSNDIVQRKIEMPAPPAQREASVKSPQPDSNDIVQRKIEMPAPPARREANAKISPPESNEVVQRKIEQPAAFEPHDSNAESSPPVSSENVQRQVEQTTPSTLRGFTSEVKVQESPNVGKPELLLARPAQKLTADTPSLPVALPLKKSVNLDISAIVKPAMPVAQLKIDPTPVVQPAEPSASIAPPVVQRQPETRAPQQKQEAPLSKFILDTAPESAAKVVSQLAIPAASQQAEEMSLRKHLENKQSAFGGLSLEVGRIRPVTAARNILQLKNSPIQRRLAPSKKEITFEALPSVKSPSTVRTQSEALKAQPESFSLYTPAFSPAAQMAASAPVPMALAKINAAPAPIQRAALQMPVAQLTPEKPVENSVTPQAGATQNVIQRAVVEQHNEPQHIQYPPTQDSASSGSVNITDLAEKIFPLVKQLLEIESERTGGRFR